MACNVIEQRSTVFIAKGFCENMYVIDHYIPVSKNIIQASVP